MLPGLELAFNDADPTLSAHVVAVGLGRYVDLSDCSLESALASARAHGAALVAAHPYEPERLHETTRGTAAFAARADELVPLVDRFELFNRHTLFPWVAEAGLPAVASGDFHRLEHLRTWKTLLPCEGGGCGGRLPALAETGLPRAARRAHPAARCGLGTTASARRGRARPSRRRAPARPP